MARPGWSGFFGAATVVLFGAFWHYQRLKQNIFGHKMLLLCGWQLNSGYIWKIIIMHIKFTLRFRLKTGLESRAKMYWPLSCECTLFPSSKTLDTPNQHRRTSGGKGLLLCRLCLGQKVTLEHPATTKAYSQLAHMFCTCVRGKKLSMPADSLFSSFCTSLSLTT